jgi:aspartyl-tRNA(Asn)/glutamyl-tRNA(Gln) amidotransferase subunit A
MITETSVHHLSATELLDLYRRKALSPLEVTKAVLDRIAHWEPSLKTTYAPDPEGALAQAARPRRWSRRAGRRLTVPVMMGRTSTGVAIPPARRRLS